MWLEFLTNSHGGGQLKPGQNTKIKDLQVGDYFEDETKRLFRKISPVPIKDVVFNVVDVYTKNMISVNEDYDIVFLKHIPWNEDIDRREIFWPTIDELGLEHQVEFFENYLYMMESFIESQINDCNRELDNYPKDYEPNYDQTYQIGEMIVKGDPVAEDIHEINDRMDELENYSNLLRKSYFISLYTFLESRLNRECIQRSKFNSDTKITLKDLNGRGIARAKTYLVKVLGSNFPFGTSAEWKEIQWYMKLRNCIVHSNGEVADPKLENYIENHDGLSYDSNGWVFLTKGFCRTALTTIKNLFAAQYHYFKYDEIHFY